MTVSFNLVDQPWIPCITTDGMFVELGLRDVLIRAPDLKRFAGETPIINMALLPLFLAILHRAVNGPRRKTEWLDLYDAGAFPVDAVNSYLDRWYERFDLFSAERPFYQASDKRADPKPIIHLVHSIGNNGTLFAHEHDSAWASLAPAQAARLLVASQQYHTAGLFRPGQQTFTDAPYARGVIFWAAGSTLWETLILNLMAYPTSDDVMPCTADDAPAWEMDDADLPVRNTPLGYLDYLTWQSNNIWFVPEEAGGEIRIRQMTIAPSMRLSEDVVSPQKRYVTTEKQKKDMAIERKTVHLYFNERKALWRDYHTIVRRDDRLVRPPHIVNWLATLIGSGLDRTKRHQLAAGGMLSDQAKIIFYREETLPLPATLLQDDSAVLSIQKAIEYTDAVYERLRKAVRRLALRVTQRGGESDPDKNDVNALMDQWDVQSIYWAQLEPAFWEFVDRVSGDDDDLLEEWKSTLKQTAIQALHRAALMAGHDAGALRGMAESELQLLVDIKKEYS
jgi:CRISPR system Cascade subunit CasA